MRHVTITLPDGFTLKIERMASIEEGGVSLYLYDDPFEPPTCGIWIPADRVADVATAMLDLIGEEDE